MKFKEIIGIVQVIFSVAIGIVGFFIFFDSNIRNSQNLPYTLRPSLLILGILIALIALLQGIINIRGGKVPREQKIKKLTMEIEDSNENNESKENQSTEV